MIDSMWRTVPKEGLLSGSQEEDMYRDMLNEALAESISQGKGIGVKDVIFKDINKVSKKS
jgi:Rod binding domain-containing protein